MSSASLNRILYVEDDPDIRAISMVALETIGGFTVRACASGQKAIDVVLEFQPELLLLDVMMPAMDGPTTLRALHKVPGCEGIPGIFMTAKVQPLEVEEYKALGVIGVIAKPFDPLMLAAEIRSLWSARG